MTFRRLWRRWDHFLFSPISPIPVAIYRILLGSLVLTSGILLLPDLETWYGANGVLPPDIAQGYLRTPGPNPLLRVGSETRWLYAFFAAHLAAAACLTFGLYTRLSSFAVFVGLVFLHRRNPLILNGGDTFMRLAAFYLVFSPAGRALSIDRWLRVRRGLESAGQPPAPAAPWAQRLIQMQLAIAYFVTAWWKLGGPQWVNGMAVYYVVHLQEFRRFPLPSWLFDNLWVVRLATWGTLVIEFALATLVWFRDLRYPVLLTGLLLHLGLEYTLNIPLFQWVMVSTYVLFIPPCDWQRAGRWLSRRRRPIPAQPAAESTA